MTTPNVGQSGGTQYGWHSVESYLRCQKEYVYQHVHKVKKLQIGGPPEALAVGTLMHAGRAAFLLHTDTLAAMEVERARLGDECSEAAWAKSCSLIEHYKNYYTHMPAPRTVATEYFLEGKLVDVFNNAYPRTARLDDVSEYPGVGLCIGEFKTTSGSIAGSVEQYTHHGQPLLQMLLWELDPNGQEKYGPIKGVMLDIMTKPYRKGETPKFARQLLPHNSWAIGRLYTSMLRWLIAKERTDVAPRMAMRNYTACTRMIGEARLSCPYRELCAHGPAAVGGYTVDGVILRASPQFNNIIAEY